MDEKENDKQEEIIDKNTETFVGQLSLTKITGIILIVASVVAVFFWIQFYSIDTGTIESYLNSTDITQVNLTAEQVKQSYTICGSIGIITSILCVLSGILTIKKKKWNIAIALAIPQLGLSIMLLIMSFILDILIIGFVTLIGVFLLYKAKQFFD